MDACTQALDLLVSNLDQRTLDTIAIVERVKTRFLETDRDDQFSRQFEWLMTNLATRADPDRPRGPGNRREARCLVVVGESGAGKTRLLTRTFERHQTFAGYNDQGSDCRLVTVSLPAPCTLLQLGRQILAAIGYPLDRELKEHLVWERVFFRLQFRGMLVLHLDEMHNILGTANVPDLGRIRKTLKSLLVHRRWPVGLIVSGLPEIVSFLESMSLNELDDDGNLVPLEFTPQDRETELRRRCRVIRLEPLELPDDLIMVEKAAADVAELGGLRLGAGFKERVAPRLVHASLYELGTMMELISETVEDVLTPRAEPDAGSQAKTPPVEELRLDDFANLYADRTGCAASANPFLVAEWWTVDCRKVLRTKNEPDPVPIAKAKPKSSKKGKRG